MNPAIIVVACLLMSNGMGVAEERSPSFEYAVAIEHELKPHRHIIPVQGLSSGFHQLRIGLSVSPAGEVIDAVPGDDPELAKFWPQLQAEVRAWKFSPFEVNGRPVTAAVEEYLDLVPPERFPTRHVAPPQVRPQSKVSITLERTMCYGRCPDYAVTLSTTGIVFEGGRFVVASGRHTGTVQPDVVRDLAKKIVAADFYSMDPMYRASVTDNPTFRLSITIDGRTAKVEDYVGQWVGMPAVIVDLEEAVDEAAGSRRWVNGNKGLVDALKAEKFDFHSTQAEEMMREASRHGETATVKEFVAAGVPPEK